jgi:excisionase family DNA binding protein
MMDAFECQGSDSRGPSFHWIANPPCPILSPLAIFMMMILGRPKRVSLTRDPRSPAWQLHEVAYLAVTPAKVYRLVSSGELAHVRVRRAVRFRMADADRCLEERTNRRLKPNELRFERNKG